jgi:hypothetical protein
MPCGIIFLSNSTAISNNCRNNVGTCTIQMLEEQVDASGVQYAVRYLLQGQYPLLHRWNGFGRTDKCMQDVRGCKALSEQAWITARKDDTLHHGLVPRRCKCRVIRTAHPTNCSRYRQSRWSIHIAVTVTLFRRYCHLVVWKKYEREMAAVSIRCCTREKFVEDYDVKNFSDNNFRRKKRKNVQGMKCDTKFFFCLGYYLDLNCNCTPAFISFWETCKEICSFITPKGKNINLFYARMLCSEYVYL